MKNIKEYDAIIAGASFAGLAVASKINNGNVLLIDREDIGTHQRSACGAVVSMVKDVGCEKSILKTFDVTTLHTKNREIDIPLAEPFCTIDYEKFCRLLAEQNNAEFLKTSIKGVKGSTVVTGKGSFKSRIIADCTGWEAALASSLQKNYVNKKMLSFGLETEIPYKDNKLRFFVDDNIIKNGAGWLFPCKKTARFGVGSFAGDTQILPNLKKLLEKYNLRIGKLHGGFFGYCIKDPIVKNIFVVGDAAGQALPLTGEGIRRSVYFGLRCGEIIQKILDDEISLKDGQKEYKELALRNKKYYNKLLKAQKKLETTANWKINLIAGILSYRPIAGFALKRYLKI